MFCGMITSIKARQKKSISSGWLYLLSVCGFIVALFIVVQYHSHLQLGNESIPSKILVDSRLISFAKYTEQSNEAAREVTCS
jgi:hypothetical protein